MLFVGVKLREGRGHSGGTSGQAGVQRLGAITATSVGLKACKPKKSAELLIEKLSSPKREPKSQLRSSIVSMGLKNYIFTP